MAMTGLFLDLLVCVPAVNVRNDPKSLGDDVTKRESRLVVM
jgi:hypothetical protein